MTVNITYVVDTMTRGFEKQANTSQMKAHTLLNIKCLCFLWREQQKHSGGMRMGETMTVFTSAQALAGWPGFTQRSPVLRSPGLGSFLKKIREAELKWSTSGLWTEDHKVSWSMKQGEERYRGSERGRVGWLKREPNKRGEELCVMSVFPCQSYFEMWLNSPPSVRLVYGLRAAKPPTERTWSWHIIAKTQAVYGLDVWIIFCIIKLFKKHKAKTISMDVMCLRWKIVSLSIKVNPYYLNFLQTKELVSLFLP